MTEAKTYPHAVDDDALPDDPRDCCRAILDALMAVDGTPTQTLPGDYAILSFTLLEAVRISD
ncbi:MAG TPA: hypothetical protein VMM55_02830, partial [Thermohalobaculum sp.]|nr:hypothetical protein [Thermohalobaculum sp.]